MHSCDYLRKILIVANVTSDEGNAEVKSEH